MVADLPSGAPLLTRLPAVYQEDPFARRFVAAFDDALAPTLATLDALGAYVDPRLAPADFLAWVGEWVGIDVDDTWPVKLAREVVSGAALLHRRRGTVPGLADAVRLALGPSPAGSGPCHVEVEDSGGATWSTSPGTPMPGAGRAGVTVRVRVPMYMKFDPHRIERFVASVKPAHVPHTVVITVGEGTC